MIDAHCHLQRIHHKSVRQVIDDAGAAGVSAFVLSATVASDWETVLELGRQYSNIFVTLGFHPYFLSEHKAEQLSQLRVFLKKSAQTCSVVAVGECGLDGRKEDVSGQEWWFLQQIYLANEFGLPLVVHSVSAHDCVYKLLRRECEVGGLIHGFSGSYEQAMHFVDLGFSIGVGGAITHLRANKTRRTIARLPLEALVLESDSPDMSPVGVAPGQNEPSSLVPIFDSLALLREESREYLSRTLDENVCRLFGLPVSDG